GCRWRSAARGAIGALEMLPLDQTTRYLLALHLPIGEMHMLQAVQDIFSAIKDNLVSSIALAGLIGAGIVTVIEVIRIRRERENLTIERRRLAEVNLGMEPEFTTEAEGHTAYVSLRLPFQNKGDGPVDLLGVLVSARALTPLGAGTNSRDVGWEDYRQLPWNHPAHRGTALTAEDAAAAGPDSLFRGFSTTRLLTISPDQYPRLAVNENLELLRMEAIMNNSP